MKKYFPFTGIVISVFISLLGNILRLRSDDLAFSLNSLIVPFLNSLLCWLAIQFIIVQKRPSGYVAKGGLAVFICVVLSFILFFTMQDSEIIQQRIASFPKGIRAAYFWLVIRGIVIGGFLFFITYLLKKATISHLAQLENERLKKENLKARLNLLKEQINPHFLFNSLGTLQSMISDSSPKRFIQKLADVYRYILNTRVSDLIELHKEIDFAKSYLYILMERFENGLIVEIKIDENHMTKKLPPFTIQMLIENAVKHNITDAQTPLRIDIYINETNSLAVSNSLQKKRYVNQSNGMGLSNIANRYRLLSGRGITIDKSERLFTVYLPLL